ncbi:Uncharacterized protein HSRCO_2349 [Halanaeroarchaeum sp. HSR-CO]|uniref:hypothetical protein n=1 Tax=Halanaeroarchaeum sp. HSR-CO TaxID=2866382 RepID=UPI00217E5919|nr:hypothetical protein [Halanaeroarchaeum sp. HSR-CO]UWG48615.1 Uncharacterized protein HSRCO_2349 [Halanaeroarchaeum sp. HSR-CO]
MPTNDLYEYDVEFAIPGQRRDSFERWLPMATCRWGIDRRVVSFEEQHNDTGLGPETRFVFGFESLEDWAGFVEGRAHSENMETLRELASTVQATLWYPPLSRGSPTQTSVVANRQ